MSRDCGTDTAENRLDDLAAADSQYRSLVCNVLEIVLEVDDQGQLIFLNPAWSSQLGFPVEESLGRCLQDFVQEENRAGLKHFLADSAPGRAERQRQELLFRHREGRLIWFELSLRRTDSGRRQGLLHNIDRWKRVEPANEGTADAARRSQGEFLANIRHEVRTPMTAILGYADMLSSQHTQSLQREEALDAIRKNGQHLLQLIDAILDLSDSELEKRELVAVPTSPWQLLVEILALFRAAARDKGLVLGLHARGPLPRTLLLDPGRMRRLVTNLLDNAVKFSKRGQIDVTAALQQDNAGKSFLSVEVKDEGIGIPADKLPGLFAAFQQGDQSMTRRFGGAGLGLCSAQRLARALQGELSVVSQLGQGSCFTLLVPVRSNGPLELVPTQELLTDPEKGPKPAAAKTAPPRLRGRILVAEDNRTNQRVIAYYLQQAGLEVEIASNGRVAIEKALQQSFDLILMDMQMPEVDGYAATRELRRGGYTKPIIALTANASRGDQEVCLNAGCTAYQAKPVEPATLYQLLAAHLPAEAAASVAVQGRTEGRDPAGRLRSTFWDDAGFRPLIQEYAASLPGMVVEINAALAQDQCQQLQSLAHQGKGAAGMYGFASLGEAFGLLEAACRNGLAPALTTGHITYLATLVEEICRGVEKS